MAIAIQATVNDIPSAMMPKTTGPTAPPTKEPVCVIAVDAAGAAWLARTTEKVNRPAHPHPKVNATREPTTTSSCTPEPTTARPIAPVTRNTATVENPPAARRSIFQPAKSRMEKLRDKKLQSAFLAKADWHTDYDKARAIAKKEKKLIFTYFARSYAP